MTKVHRIVLMVVDHDDIGIDEVRETIENAHYPNRCIAPTVMAVETKEVDWDDNHPLNTHATQRESFAVMFGPGKNE